MRYVYKPSFLRTLRSLEHQQQLKTERAILALMDYFQSGQRTEGLGLKQLRKPYWEIRVGLDTRIMFLLEGDLVSFIIVGDHNDIRRYLKHV